LLDAWPGIIDGALAVSRSHYMPWLDKFFYVVD
jgi:hypothetical protein